MTMWGLELVRAVIEKVSAQGFKSAFGDRHVIGSIAPVPVAADVLEQFRFDGDVPLSPCLKEWLAFDGSLFGWFDRIGPRAEKIGALAERELQDDMFHIFERTLSQRCYPLPFSNMEYLSFVYPSAPDSTGELPVMCAETENQQVLVTHPGIDTFLGYHAGLLERDWYKPIRSRFTEHHQHALGGKQALVFGEDDYVPPEPTPEDLPPGVVKTGEDKYLLEGDDPVPAGFVVMRGEGMNPFTKKRLRFLRRA